MKKCICRILSVILVVCLMVIPVNATSDAETTNGFTYTPILTNGEPSPGGSFTIDDVQLAPIRSDAETFSLYATRYFGFGELLYNNIMSDWVEYEVQQGDDEIGRAHV